MLINLKRIAYYIKNDPQHLSLSHVRPKILKELQAVKEYIENLEALICQVCCDEQEDEDYVGCCQDGNCSHGIEHLCKHCGEWDEEKEQWICPSCLKDKEKKWLCAACWKDKKPLNCLKTAGFCERCEKFSLNFKEK